MSTAFEEWYRSDYPRVLVAVAIVCHGDHSRAEDATNDAFVEAIQRWDRVGQMDNPTGWVTRVAINRARRSIRRHRRRIELQNQASLQNTTNDYHPDFDLWSSLNSLTLRQRKALVLRYLDDLSQTGVAAELGVSVGTASATLSQARQRLRTSSEESSVQK